MSLIWKKVTGNKYLLLLALFSIFITWPLFLPGYFPHHDDLQVMRILEMRKCFEDGQIPCRWIPDMGLGYGFPLFNYYSVLPYVVGALLSYPLGFIGAAKALFFIPLFLGGFSMYFLLKELFKGQMAAFFGAVLFLFAPYRAVDSYVRGAISESFAIAIVPLVFLFSLKLIRIRSLKNLLLTAIFLGLFLLCHNIMSLFFMPFLILWIIFWMWHEKRFPIKHIFVSILLGVGLAAFFILPAFLEKNLVHIDTLTQTNLDFRIHYSAVNQLFFDRSWGYGPSRSGINDGMSFQLGFPHWVLALVAFLVSLAGFFKIKLFNKYREEALQKDYLLPIFISVIFLVSIFMIHNKSAFVWESIRSLQFAQFPWRFLSVVIFTNSILGAFFISIFKFRIQKIMVIILTILTVFLNWSYFKPEKFYLDMTDSKKLTGKDWVIQQEAAIWDYLPKSATEAPKTLADGKYQLLTPNTAIVNNVQSGTNFFNMDVKVIDHTILRFNQIYFPEWKIFVNGKEEKFESKDNSFGLMSLILGEGDYRIEAKLYDTPIRFVSNLISLFSLIVLLGLMTIQIPKIKKYLSYYLKSLS